MERNTAAAKKSGPLGIYMHVPYCIKKCRYCDFVSFEKAPEDAYFQCLAEDITRGGRGAAGLLDMPGDKPSADTVFFGGGTPSLASKEQLETLLNAVRRSFDLLPCSGREEPEITIEVNPETVSSGKAAELKALGFSRVSMGVQSLNDKVLKAMGRVHSAQKAREAHNTLRSAGFDNLNMDLIFGAPGQDLKIWKDTLGEVISMRPEHISFYSLQLEEGTPLYDDYTSGRVGLPSWELNREMYHLAAEALKATGYHHYEISNAALPGFECRHNLKYWSMQQYLGFGTSAHSFIAGRRGEADYSNGDAFGLKEETEEELKGDFIFTALRLTEGMDAGEWKRLFGSDIFEELGDALEEQIGKGLLAVEESSGHSGKMIRFTPEGLDRTNPVMEALIGAAGGEK